ncbi:MAG: hypothetical protein AAFQ89_05355 [Cyanobacteria bacterium J06626_18]
MPVRDYRSDLLVRLANPEFAALYLKAALDEILKDGAIASPFYWPSKMLLMQDRLIRQI